MSVRHSEDAGEGGDEHQRQALLRIMDEPDAPKPPCHSQIDMLHSKTCAGRNTVFF